MHELNTNNDDPSSTDMVDKAGRTNKANKN